MTNFALLQTNIAFCDPEANFKRVRELFAQAMAKDPRPDVVVLPEDWSAGFSDEMFHHMEDFVEPENGPSVTVLRELARQYQVWVVGGSIATLHADGKMRNTTFLIDRRLSQSQGEPLAHPSDRPRHREPDVRGGLQPGGPQPYGDLLRPLHHHRPLGRHHRGGRR